MIAPGSRAVRLELRSLMDARNIIVRRCGIFDGGNCLDSSG